MNKFCFAVAAVLMMLIVSCENQSDRQIRNGLQVHKDIFEIYGLYQAQAKDFDIIIGRDGDVYQLVDDVREYVGRIEVKLSYFAVKHDGVDVLHIELGTKNDRIMVTDKTLHIGYSMHKVDWADRLKVLSNHDEIDDSE